MMPLSRQDEFFVPEFSEELASNATTEMSSHVDADVDVDERDVSVTASFREASVPRSVTGGRGSEPPMVSLGPYWNISHYVT